MNRQVVPFRPLNPMNTLPYHLHYLKETVEETGFLGKFLIGKKKSKVALMKKMLIFQFPRK